MRFRLSLGTARSKWLSCASDQEGCALVDVFKALGHLVGICIGMLS